jgi:hypothetical protein
MREPLTGVDDGDPVADRRHAAEELVEPELPASVGEAIARAPIRTASRRGAPRRREPARSPALHRL